MLDGGPRKPSSFHFLAGLSTGMLSAFLLQPADLLKTRVQQSHNSSLLLTIREICSGPSPIRELWRGTLPSIIRTGLGSALYFSSLNALRQHVASSNLLFASSRLPLSFDSSSSLPRLSPMANLTTGAIARASAGFAMMPITVIKVRYESSLYTYRSLWGAGTAILRTEGPKGFFTGFGATAARDAPYAGLYVLFYESLKKRLSALAWSGMTPGRTEMTTATAAPINFMSGVLAAGLATTLTNPFDAVKTRLQLMPGRYGNMVYAVKTMLREEGIRSLFDGLALRVGRKAASSALAWTLYEELIRSSGRRWEEGAKVV